MREINFERNYIIHPAGSCLASFGETKVICTVSIEDGVPGFLRGSGKGWLTAEYAMLPGSTGGGRKRREFGRRDGRGVEISRLIGRSLRAGVHLDRLGEVTVIVDCDVLQADGGTRTAGISGAWVALHDALTQLATTRELAGPQEWLKGQIAAVSVGICAGQVVCDLDYAHDSTAEVDLNVVARDGEFVEIQGTGEGGTFDRSALDGMLDAADLALTEIRAAQRASLGL